MIIDDCSSLIT